MESISLDFTETAVENDVQNDKYGERMKFDAAGPYQKARTKTDFCWLVGFIVYLLIWSGVIIYAFSSGDTSKWLKPKDSAGRICGYDSDVEDKPYLVHYNPDTCKMPHCLVCRSACPKEDFDYPESAADVSKKVNLNRQKRESNTKEEETKPQNNDNSQDTKKQTEEKTAIEGDGKSEKTTTNANTEKPTETTTVGDKQTETHDKDTSKDTNKRNGTENSNETAKEKKVAPQSSTNLGQTIENIVCQSDVKLELINKWDELDYLVEHHKCSKSYKKTDNISDYRCDLNTTTSDSWRSTLPLITRDLSNTKWSIMGFIMLSGMIALASIFLMRWYALAYVCISIFVVCALAFHFIYEKCVLNAENKTNGVLLSLFLGVVVLVLIVLIAIYFRRQLSLACQMIKESSKAVTCVLSSIAVPFFFFALYMLIFILGLSVYYLLTSLEYPVYKADFATGEVCECPASLGYTQNSTCDPLAFTRECRKPSGDYCVLSGCYMAKKVRRNVGFLHLINFVGLIWSFWFVVGFNDTVLASVYATWYWTFNKKILSYLSVLESFWRIGTYHLGTIALGSLIIVICATIREILKMTQKSLEKINRPFSALILLNLQCVFDLMERFLNFINRRAYIMCAMHGTDFFQSARTAYYLLMRNVGRVIAVVTVTNWLTFIVTVLISCITTRISMSYYDSRVDDVTFSHIPPMIVFFGSYVIACLVMRLIEVAVDTIFHCFLEDTERNDGTNDKPYFMSEELTKFLYIK